MPGSAVCLSSRTTSRNIHCDCKYYHKHPALIDLHRRQKRQGPGSDSVVEQVIKLSGLDKRGHLKIADIGCGTGAASLQLARHLNADIVAVDFLQEFLDTLEVRAQEAHVSNSITTRKASMDDLPFENASFDVIWSEGAIYNIGFERGAREWARFLRPRGVLVASEITWTTASRPAELQQYWDSAYPEIDTTSNKIAVLENCGYSPVGYFTLSQECWLNNYYRPLEESFDAFLNRNGNSETARALVAAEREEISLYTKYRDYYSYGMYIAEKRP